MYLLDTSTVIYSFKGMGRVKERLLETERRLVAIPAITLFELETGVAKAPESVRLRSQLDTFVKAIRVEPFDEPTARVAARIRAALEGHGEPIGPFDTLIAATAVACDATLVTHNTRQLRRVEDLRLEDWY
jgi:tRNA(fMet)-specific endonuclease VapC